MKNKIAILTAIALLFSALGFWFGKRHSTPSQVLPSPSQSTTLSDTPLPVTITPAEAIAEYSDPTRQDIDSNARLWKKLEALSPDQFPTTLSEILKISSKPDRESALSALFERWSRIDLPGAIAAFKQMKEGDDKSTSLRSLIGVWATHDLESALAYIDSQSESNKQIGYANLIAKLASKEPEKAYQLLVSKVDKESFMSAANSFLQKITKKDPLLAIAKAKELQALHKLPGYANTTLINTVLRSWAQANPNAAWDWLVSNASQFEGDKGGLWGIFDAFLEQKQEQFSQKLNGLPKEILKENVWSIARSWGEKDPQAAGQWIQSLQDLEMKQSALYNYMSVLVDKNPQQAINYMNGLKPIGVQSTAAAELMRNWINKEPEKAEEWLKALPEGEIKLKAMQSAISTISENNPAKAASMAIENLSSREMLETGSIFNIARSWTQKNPEEAMTWASQISDETSREEIKRYFLSQWSQVSPKKAAEFILAHQQNGFDSSDVSLVFSQWVKISPTQATESLMKLPDGEIKNRAAASILSNWLQENPTNAVAWVNQLPRGDLRDKAITGSVNRFSNKTNFNQSAELINTMTNTQERQRAIQQLGPAWLKKDRSSAEAWIQASDLSDEQKQKLLEVKK